MSQTLTPTRVLKLEPGDLIVCNRAEGFLGVHHCSGAVTDINALCADANPVDEASRLQWLTPSTFTRFTELLAATHGLQVYVSTFASGYYRAVVVVQAGHETAGQPTTPSTSGNDPRVAQAIAILGTGGPRQDSKSDQLQDVLALGIAAGCKDAVSDIQRALGE
jgi:hypothetical protein